MILDGYDEYIKGTNECVEDIIENGIGDCFVIVTSRPGNFISEKTLSKFGGKLTIKGFSEYNIRKSVLEGIKLSEEMLEAARETGLYDLLHIPVILLMVCVLFRQTRSLPKSLTKVMERIIDLCIDRSAMKHLGKRRSEIEGLDEMLFKLGELSWNTLKRPVQQLLLSKVLLSFGA